MNLGERKDNKHWQMATKSYESYKMQQQIPLIKITNEGEIYYINKTTKEMETIQNQEENSYDDDLSYQDEH